MTEKQIARVVIKIAKYKKALAADKKRWGGFHDDSRGIRYLIPALYIQIKDYKGALRYFNWFDKAFPDDSGYPIFLFEWAFVLFKCNKLPDAEQKLHLTFFSNTYLLDKFLEKEFLVLNKNESSNWENASLTEHFHYRKNEPEFIEFADWVSQTLNSRLFLDKANKFIEIERQLEIEPVGKKRSELVRLLGQLRYGLNE